MWDIDDVSSPIAAILISLFLLLYWKLYCGDGYSPRTLSSLYHLYVLMYGRCRIQDDGPTFSHSQTQVIDKSFSLSFQYSFMYLPDIIF